ncbi:MAG TPA: imidazole glycerol phosphate synthase subunit HisF [Longimicrobiales bacterium]|nr:imidazole glycerol phosphate synthase subunit HisF [Longimicrobiales bacterium]
MLLDRVIVCLDVDAGRVVKGVRFRALRDMGDPVELAVRYEAEGADEIVFLDVSASAQGRRAMLDAITRTAERLFIPLTVGGGISRTDDIARLLRAGADKVAVNTAAVRRPELLEEAAVRFGSQCVVASIDARLEPGPGPASDGDSAPARPGDPRTRPVYRVYTHGGRTPTGREAVAWGVECAHRGAGELLLTSIDRDGTREGFDLDLTGAVARRVSVPVIASGGAGGARHFLDAFRTARASAALAAGIFHEGVITVGDVKKALASAGLPVRLAV